MHWIAGRANIISEKIIYIFFSILGMVFVVLFQCYFQKLELLVVKKIWTNFCWCTSICMSSKVSHILKILFQTGDINIFVLCGVFFSRYVQLKSSFSDKKNHQQWNLRHWKFSSYQKLMWQSIKEKFHQWQKLELCKLIQNAKLHWKR